MLNQSCEVHDPQYFLDIMFQQEGKYNWVYEEMWTYWKKKYPQWSYAEMQRHLASSKCDLLEVYCAEHSQLTHQATQLGMRAFRFSLRHGDLATFSGRCKLYELLWVIRPRHIWVAPKCGPWSNWNRLNASKSQELSEKIANDRKSENVHLLLCDGLFRFQDWRGSQFHFHLEQPQGSELVYQDEMEAIVNHTHKALCDMCIAGNLKHPNSHEHLRKRTQILTTSEVLCRTIEKLQCVGNHTHDQVAGSCKPFGYPRMPVTKYSELYTASFGRKISRAIQCSSQVHEKVFGNISQSVFAAEPSQEIPEPKRRRLAGKFNPEQLFVPASGDATASSSSQVPPPPADSVTTNPDQPGVDLIIDMADKATPRVGRIVFQDGPLLEVLQSRYPDKHIVAIDCCRGVDRLRTCPIGTKGFAPFRRCVGKRRSNLSTFEDSEWEAWEEISKRQQIRNGIPSKLLVSVFATHKRQGEDQSEVEPVSKKICVDPKNEDMSGVDPLTNINDPSITKATDITPNTREDSYLPNQSDQPQSAINTDVSHGPKFLKLDSQKQNMIRKIHQNLGHPDNRVLQMALRRYGWSESDAAACSDFSCSTCFEKQLPKVARPGTLSKPRDFNDHISFDGAEWKDPQGKMYHFYHFIDSATNYHVAVPYQQRSTEGLIEAFSNAWLRWAGPPKSIMFDSTTEANSDQFAKYLQDLAIQSYVIPVNAHWQLGRAERHGAILMRMIDKYHTEKPIRNQEDFNHCLMQLCHAKNAMSRHEGYTPELWVLGKMKPVPGSNTNQYLDSASFSGLDMETTEGARFQEQLSRREAARIAFIRADHCATLRRALHARSRPDRMTCQVGDCVMYWKDGKGVERTCQKALHG